MAVPVGETVLEGYLYNAGTGAFTPPPAPPALPAAPPVKLSPLQFIVYLLSQGVTNAQVASLKASTDPEHLRLHADASCKLAGQEIVPTGPMVTQGLALLVAEIDHHDGTADRDHRQLADLATGRLTLSTIAYHEPPFEAAFVVLGVQPVSPTTAVWDRVSELERQLVQIAGKQASHEEVCGVRYKALEEKVDKIDGAMEQQGKTLAAIKESLNRSIGGRKMLVGIATLIGVPVLGFLGALLSGLWAAKAAGG